MSEEPKPKGKRGGKRPGAGRKPTGRRKYSTAAEQARQRAVDSGIKLPLEWYLDMMNDERRSLEFRYKCASEALPYCHVKLEPMRITTSNGGQQGLSAPGDIGGIERRVITIEGDIWQGTDTPAIADDSAVSQTEDQDTYAGSIRPIVRPGEI